MLNRRTAAAMLTTALLTVLATAPTAAARPTRPATHPSLAPGERPLTAEEQAASDAKVASAEAYVASVEAQGGDLGTLACTPPTPSTADDGTDGATTDSCHIPQGYLPVYARDQQYGHYCGPAVGQVISNYAWAMSSSANRYAQRTIASWMQTDARGYTNAPELEDGLERGTSGAPRRPAGFDWVVTGLSDTDRDGTVGDQLQNYLRSAISSWKMPVAIPVKPHAHASQYNLSSWARPVSSPGHWIAAYGWYGNWNGTTFSRIYFTDSSRDEGGSTGKFWNPTRDIGALIMEHTRRFVW